MPHKQNYVVIAKRYDDNRRPKIVTTNRSMLESSNKKCKNFFEQNRNSWCPSYIHDRDGNRWVCTRKHGHKGSHIGHASERNTVAIWSDEVYQHQQFLFQQDRFLNEVLR